eukprot:CAMPEP_0197193418 /NCGR_PEP_ID=MMETSP1423-20130617/27128_1 /TAXON_ID=476441 /ORGANISM="Pseudo-nitzschia heimii, Strain UNC1101" /LENGTH=220 /DNA_ID=CAMNT_0042646605 /DNA_START=580 /DNA_END=1242 /DNA_ORIENTATION=+
MWIPSMLFMFVLAPWLPMWVDFFGGAWSHMQGGLSAYLVLFKPDIWKAFKKFFTRYQENESDSNFSSSRCSRFSSIFRHSSTLVLRRPSGNGILDLESMNGPVASGVSMENNIAGDGLSDMNDSEIIIFSEKDKTEFFLSLEQFSVNSGINLEDDIDVDSSDSSSNNDSVEMNTFSDKTRNDKNANPNSTLELCDSEGHVDANGISTEPFETEEILELKP